MSLEQNFKDMADKVRHMSPPSDADSLELYSLYKQSTVGDCSTGRPRALDVKGKAKWDAWNGKKGISQDDAKEKYINKVSASTSTALKPASSQQRAVAVKVLTEEGGKVKERPNFIGTLPRVSASTCTAGGSGSSQQQVAAVQLRTERGSRAEKVKQCISHQQELHDLRKQVIEEDLLRAKECRKAAQRRVGSPESNL